MEELYPISDTYDAKSNSDLIIRRKIVPSVRCKDATNTYIKEEISLENPILNDPENRRKFPEKELNREIVNEIIAAATAVRNPTELADRVAITPTTQLRVAAETQK